MRANNNTAKQAIDPRAQGLAKKMMASMTRTVRLLASREQPKLVLHELKQMKKQLDTLIALVASSVRR